MKRPLASARTLRFHDDGGSYGKPLRAAAQWVQRNEPKLDSVLAVGFEMVDGVSVVTLSVESMALYGQKGSE